MNKYMYIFLFIEMFYSGYFKESLMAKRRKNINKKTSSSKTNRSNDFVQDLFLLQKIPKNKTIT